MLAGSEEEEEEGSDSDEALEEESDSEEEEDSDQFLFVEINCRKIGKPDRAFSQFHRALKPQVTRSV